MVDHVEEVLIDRSLADVLRARDSTRLEDAIQQGGDLPFVTGTFDLQDAPYGDAGTRRIACLSDGSTLQEEVLENTVDPNRAVFSYVVWDYSSAAARPVLFGEGAFVFEAVSESQTRVRWRYAFQLRSDRFPGVLGPFGRFLFRVSFLERDYATMMRSTLKAQKDRAEAMP